MDFLVVILFVVGASGLLVSTLLVIRIFWRLTAETLRNAHRSPDPNRRRRALVGFWLSAAWMILLLILVIAFEITQPFGENSLFAPIFVSMGICAVGLFVVGLVGAIQGIRRGRQDRRATRPTSSGS